MNLPIFILTYSRALLSAPWRFTLTYLSYFTDTSHDYLTRNISKKIAWNSIIKHLLFGRSLNQGYLIIDETDIDKSFAKKIKGLGWIFSHRKNKYIFGYHLVVVVWTNEKVTIPIALKLYKKGGKTKLDLALELIIYCTCVLNIKPKAWLFDSLYSSEKILSFLNKRDLTFHTQIKKNRLLDHRQVKHYEKGRPYWTKTGYLKGKIKVQLVKNRRKYYITNDLSIPRKKQLDTYKIRWKIEEVFRFVKQELGFERCQSQNLQAQINHFTICFVLFAILQDIAEKTQLTVYAIKLKATRDPLFVKNLNLSCYFDSA